MIGINHGLTGALIAHYLPLPLALPAATASHFAMDMLPHYGIDHRKRNKSAFWKVFTTIDALATLGLAVFAINKRHYAIFLGGLFATAPDYWWVAKVIGTKSFDFRRHQDWYTRWHISIQRYEYPWGIYIELPIAAVLFYVVMIRFW